MKRAIPLLVGLLFLYGGAGQAKAGTILLDLQTSSPTDIVGAQYTLDFTPSAALTIISFAGYDTDVGIFLSATSLTAGGGPNLLGATWTYTPAASTPDASQLNDGVNSVNDLTFLGFTVGSFDTFSQTIATIPGQQLELSFTLFDRHDPDTGGQSEFIVSAIPSPEPSTLVLVGIAAACAGYRGWRRRNQLLVA